MIQQKWMHRQCETGGLTAFSKAGAAVRFFKRIRRKRRTFAAEFGCYAIGHRAAEKTERHVNQLLHSGAGDLTANNDHAVAEYHTVMLDSSVSRRGRAFKEKDRLYVQSTSGLTSFSRKDNGEFGTSTKLVGTIVRLVGGEWKIHNVRRTRDVAGRNRKHQDRVERKRNTMIKERSIMRSA